MQALIRLAWTNGRATAGASSAEAQIPHRQLARLSRGAGGESRGARGKVALGSLAERITLRDAVQVTEGPSEVTRCIMQQRACGEGKPCMMHQAWEQGQETILGYLEEQSLADFVSQALPLQNSNESAQPPRRL